MIMWLQCHQLVCLVACPDITIIFLCTAPFVQYPRVVDSLVGPRNAPAMHQFSISESCVNTIRGIHCAPYGKLVQCVSGRVFDVIVDLRPASPTFGKWYGAWLSAGSNSGDNNRSANLQVYIPARCGHGFFAAEDGSVVQYCQEGTYAPGQDVEMHPMDPKIGIKWPDPVRNKSSAHDTPSREGASDEAATTCSKQQSSPHGKSGGKYVISDKDMNSSSFEQLQERLAAIQEAEGWCKDRHDTSSDGVDYVVLGASGFLGSSTVRELRRQGRTVATSVFLMFRFAAFSC